jgi:hypothetical protein
MKQQGEPIDKIMLYTGLTKAGIERLWRAEQSPILDLTLPLY